MLFIFMLYLRARKNTHNVLLQYSPPRRCKVSVNIQYCIGYAHRIARTHKHTYTTVFSIT